MTSGAAMITPFGLADPCPQPQSDQGSVGNNFSSACLDAGGREEMGHDDRQNGEGDQSAAKDQVLEPLKLFLREELLQLRQDLQEHYSDAHQELVNKMKQFAIRVPGEPQSSLVASAATPVALKAMAAKPLSKKKLVAAALPVAPPSPAQESAQQHEQDSQDFEAVPGMMPQVLGASDQRSSESIDKSCSSEAAKARAPISEVASFDGIAPENSLRPGMKRQRTQQKLLEAVAVAQERIGTEDLTWKETFSQFVHGPHFDAIMTCVIFLNAMTIGLEVEFNAGGADADVAFQWLGRVFFLIYLVELMLRLSADGLSFFKSSDAHWNWFDLSLVVLMCADELLSLTASLVDIVKLLRICRIFRLVRMVRLIPSMKQTVYLIWASIGSFGWTALLMLLVMYCFALFFTNVSTEYIADAEKLGVTDERILNLQANWGHLGDSMISLFMAITGGEDWRILIMGLSHQSIVSSLVFYFYVTFMTLVMLNLVTGVFVEGAQRIIRQEKDDELITDAVKCFMSMDEDVSGSLSFREFSAHCNHEGVLGFCKALDIVPDQAKELFMLLDKDKSGELSLFEFASGCLRFRQPARALDTASMMLEIRDLKDVVKTEFTWLSQKLGPIPASLSVSPDVHHLE